MARRRIHRRLIPPKNTTPEHTLSLGDKLAVKFEGEASPEVSLYVGVGVTPDAPGGGGGGGGPPPDPDVIITALDWVSSPTSNDKSHPIDLGAAGAKSVLIAVGWQAFDYVTGATLGGETMTIKGTYKTGTYDHIAWLYIETSLGGVQTLNLTGGGATVYRTLCRAWKLENHDISTFSTGQSGGGYNSTFWTMMYDGGAYASMSLYSGSTQSGNRIEVPSPDYNNDLLTTNLGSTFHGWTNIGMGVAPGNTLCTIKIYGSPSRMCHQVFSVAKYVTP